MSISTELLLRESASLIVGIAVVAIAASPVFTQSSSSPKFAVTSVQVDRFKMKYHMRTGR